MKRNDWSQKISQTQSDTFNLSVTLTNNKKLTLVLEDYFDMAIYSNDFTEDNFNGKIHKKSDLADLYKALSSTQAPQHQNIQNKTQKYQYGACIKIANTPCYKIQSGGNITVYHITYDQDHNQIIYQSHLKLIRKEDLTQMQIFYQKFNIEKRKMFEELSLKIQNKGKQKSDLLSRMAYLEDQNCRSKAETNEIKESLRLTKEELITKNERLESKIAQLINQNRNLQSLNHQLTASINSISLQHKSRCQNLQARLQQTEQRRSLIKYELNAKIQTQNQASNNKIANLKQALKQIKTKLYTNLPQPNTSSFKIEGPKIQFINTNQHTHYIFNQQIHSNQSTTLKLKVTQTQNKNIFLGILDYNKQKDKKYSHNSGNSLCYSGFSGGKYPQMTKQGDGFKQGDIVQIQINRMDNLVKYVVNGVLKATQNNQILSDSSITFMPFIEMFNKNDTVQLLIEE